MMTAESSLTKSPKKSWRILIRILLVSAFLSLPPLFQQIELAHKSILPSIWREIPLLEPIRGNLPGNSSSTGDDGLMVFDLLSIGSLSRIDYQEAQKRTFGTHPSVRYFFNATEEDDVERSCHEELTWEDVLAIASFCHRGKNWNPQSLMRYQRNHYARSQWLEQKKNPLGWMCAQKRPIHGLTKVLHHYRQQHEKLPDYLIIMDDDSYFQLQFVQNELMRHYSPESARALAGCLIRNRVKESNFTFPFGGYGTILSQGAIANLIRPVYCRDRQRDEFEENACRQLDKNQLEENYLFREGMSIGELMEAYAAAQPYKSHTNWTHGYCLHSDWALGFFFNYYYISSHSLFSTGCTT
jgi:hypothetical protein